MISPRRPYTLRLPSGAALHLGHRTLIMGIVNVTPDSFSDGGLFLDPDRAVAHALALEAAGADLLDLGGESTRPGANPISVQEELDRVLPVLERLRGRCRVPLSIDTYKSAVAREALGAGAAVVNDISRLGYDEALAAEVARAGAPLVVMHMRGRPQDMYREAVYVDVMAEVVMELERAIGRAVAAGVDRGQILVDPGIGFAKRAEHSLAVIGGLERLGGLDRPVLVSPSRKSFIARTLGDDSAAGRRWGSAAAVTACIFGGAHVVRVHDVEEMAAVARVADAVRGAACSNN